MPARERLGGGPAREKMLAGVDRSDLVDAAEILVGVHVAFAPAGEGVLIWATPSSGERVVGDALDPVGIGHVSKDREHLAIAEHGLNNRAQLGT